MSHLSLTAADVPSHHYLQDPSRNFLPHVIILLVLAAIQFWAVANTGENAVNKAKRWKDRTSDCLAYWHLSGPGNGRGNGFQPVLRPLPWPEHTNIPGKDDKSTGQLENITTTKPITAGTYCVYISAQRVGYQISGTAAMEGSDGMEIQSLYFGGVE